MSNFESLITNHLHGVLFRSLAETGLFAQLILVIIMIFSIGSWAIIGSKWFKLRRIRRHNEIFWDILGKYYQNLPKMYKNAQRLTYSPLAKIFIEGFRELRSVCGEELLLTRFTVRNLNIVAKTIERKSAQEILELEKHIGFLATTANACPLLGLLGTVWGVLRAFRGMGITGTASLATVAPGISEALLTTVAGLAAAIPAVILYNYFLHKINLQAQEMDQFNSRFMIQLEKAGSQHQEDSIPATQIYA